jgi:hypothetical protein
MFTVLSIAGTGPRREYEKACFVAVLKVGDEL